MQLFVWYLLTATNLSSLQSKNNTTVSSEKFPKGRRHTEPDASRCRLLSPGAPQELVLLRKGRTCVSWLLCHVLCWLRFGGHCCLPGEGRKGTWRKILSNLPCFLPSPERVSARENQTKTQAALSRASILTSVPLETRTGKGSARQQFVLRHPLVHGQHASSLRPVTFVPAPSGAAVYADRGAASTAGAAPFLAGSFPEPRDCSENRLHAPHDRLL